MSIRPKIYLDTSVISHLLADDVPEKQSDTLKLWEQLKQEEFEVVLSLVVTDEISRCDNVIKNKLYEYIAQINTTMKDENNAMTALAGEYLQTGVLGEKSYDDCRHIA